jgi:hypothetical protein
MTDPTERDLPSDYDAADSFDEGTDICARCDHEFKPIDETVVNSNGTEYDHLMDTDPGDAPFFCLGCWDELEANRKATENQTLTEWSE